ncbi:MAG: SLC13/DASS family transporter [Pseudomonadales bacterium]|nr:SLC13/DASS family transporter [Pseudomonadales bacterium]
MSIRTLALILGPLIALLVYGLFSSNQLPHVAGLTAAVACLCIIWWIFEPVPIPVTSLLPLALFQITGILTKNEVAQAYGSPIILLLLGGFILSKAMEHSGAHKRLAVFMIRLFGGTSSKRLVLGFMVSSAVLSMWISNTATTLMLLPVAVAVLQGSEDKTMAMPLMLGIAWAASIGGMGTPIGTPPNLIFMQVYEEQVGGQISFLDWMKIAVPIVVVLVPVAALWLTRNLHYKGTFQLPEIGQWRSDEKRVLMVFALTAFLWITRQEPFGGWSTLTGFTNANDASVALLAVVLMFIIPNGKKDGEALLNWSAAANIPWGVLLLFGGGICLAKAFVASGLSTMVGDQLSVLATWPVFIMMLVLCLGVTFLTETTSNTASTVLLMPILAAAALAANIDPKLLMIPAVLSASCAFMLPVATAPNSIVFGSGHVTTGQMARQGIVLNIVGALIISLSCYFLLV